MSKESKGLFPDNFEIIAESIESLLTTEMRPTGHWAAGVIKKIWRSAVEKQKGYPTMIAAKQIIENVKQGDVVIIMTGVVVGDNLPKGESDGPLGAASIAYALKVGLGATPVVICEEPVVPACTACLNTIGLGVKPLELAKKMPWAAVVESYPTNNSEGDSRAREILTSYQPKAIIAVERLGVNKKGIAHTATGKAVTDGQAKTQSLWKGAREKRILTIGVGDNGNEVGMGTLLDAICTYNKFGAKCVCGCEGGIAAAEEADVAVVANVSNWGAYGIVASMAGALRNFDLIHSGEVEERMIESCVRAGALDGRTGSHFLQVDGIPAKIHGHFVDILSCILRTGLSTIGERRY